MRVLIADGDDAFLEVARSYLSRHGLEVNTATNGLESVAILRRDVPDVVVLERELLWGGGDGVCALLQEVAGHSETRVILTSGGGIPEVPGPDVDPPFVARLQKPYRLKDLLRHLQQCRPDGVPAHAGAFVTGSHQ